MSIEPNSAEWLGAFSAFPAVNESGTVNRDGLTKRELFAAMAMQGMLSDQGSGPYLSREELEAGMTYPKTVAEMSVEYADALLAELARAAK